MSRITNEKLRRLNKTMAGVHALQGIIILAIAKDFAPPITTGYLYFDKAAKTLQSAQHTIGHMSLPLLIALFFFASALAHFTVATIGYKKYTKDLSKGINKFRWFEYALSASIMIVAISLLVGIYDVAILASAFALTAIMNLMGLMMEVHNQSTKKTSWLSYWVGTFAGLVPWAVIAYYFYASSTYGGAQPPTFVYWIFVSIFAFFSCFALNMILQYKKWGKWKDYRYGEKVYIYLSLFAKSALAWQVFAGTLRP